MPELAPVSQYWRRAGVGVLTVCMRTSEAGAGAQDRRLCKVYGAGAGVDCRGSAGQLGAPVQDLHVLVVAEQAIAPVGGEFAQHVELLQAGQRLVDGRGAASSSNSSRSASEDWLPSIIEESTASLRTYMWRNSAVSGSRMETASSRPSASRA